jgi:hypothetical protein
MEVTFMATATQPQAEATQAPAQPATPLEVPEGAHFEMEEVKTAKGEQTLGEVPILVWDKVPSAVDYYTEEGVKNILDGTSLRVSFQNIARRLKIAGKSNTEIQNAQISFKPGKRAGGVSTPVSRAARAARSAAEKVGDQADLVTQLLERIANGELSTEDLESIVS